MNLEIKMSQDELRKLIAEHFAVNAQAVQFAHHPGTDLRMHYTAPSVSVTVTVPADRLLA